MYLGEKSATRERERVQGRPKKIWNDEVGVILGKRDVIWTEARGRTKNKKEWTEFVHAS